MRSGWRLLASEFAVSVVFTSCGTNENQPPALPTTKPFTAAVQALPASSTALCAAFPVAVLAELSGLALTSAKPLGKESEPAQCYYEPKALFAGSLNVRFDPAATSLDGVKDKPQLADAQMRTVTVGGNDALLFDAVELRCACLYVQTLKGQLFVQLSPGSVPPVPVDATTDGQAIVVANRFIETYGLTK